MSRFARMHIWKLVSICKCSLGKFASFTAALRTFVAYRAHPPPVKHRMASPYILICPFSSWPTSRKPTRALALCSLCSQMTNQHSAFSGLRFPKKTHPQSTLGRKEDDWDPKLIAHIPTFALECDLRAIEVCGFRSYAIFLSWKGKMDVHRIPYFTSINMKIYH
jgi:hypothetical protein